MTGFHPLAAANELIGIAAPSGGIDHLKLQKELYIAHGIHLAVTGRPLVGGGFKAWQYGPVSPDVYHAAKPYRSSSIVGPLSGHTLATEISSLKPDAKYAQRLLDH